MNSGDESNDVSVLNVKEYLKEAGFCDETLNESEMREIYQVVKNSRSTASAEDEQRRIMEQTEANCSMLDELRRESTPVHASGIDAANDCSDVSSSTVVNEGKVNAAKEKPFTPKTWSLQKKQLKLAFDVEEQISSTTIPTKHCLSNEDSEMIWNETDKVDVFNCAPTTHKPLQRIHITPKYNPPFYCNPQMADIEEQQKAQMIYSYHFVLHRKLDKYQRQSIYGAPWGRPIQPTFRFNGSLTRKLEIGMDQEVLQQENDIREYFESLRDNSDEEFETYISKAGRSTKRKLYTEDEDDLDGSEEWKKKTKSSASSTDSKKNKVKKRVASLSNEEIMKRSKLFSDGNTPSSRSNKIFDKLAEEESKKHELDKKMEKFTESLARSSDEEKTDAKDVAELIHAEEPFIRRRVVPPSQATKPGRGKSTRGRGRKNAPTARSKTQETQHDNSSLESSQESQKYDSLEVSTSSQTDNLRKKDRCPMCNEEFFQHELMDHAPACVDRHTEKKPTTRSMSFSDKRIACENCDQVLPLDTEYEVHVKQCLAQKLEMDKFAT